MPPGDDVLLAVKVLRYDRAGLLAKPFLGAIFAVALHLLFMSGVLSGGIFPTLAIHPKDVEVEFKSFFFGTVLATDANFAKLLVWCFIGGFAERLVPDILDRLANEADKSKK